MKEKLRNRLYQQAVIKTVILTLLFGGLPLYLVSATTTPWSLVQTIPVLFAGAYAAARVKMHHVLRGYWWLVVCVAAASWPTLLSFVPTMWHLSMPHFALIAGGMLFTLSVLTMSGAAYFETILAKRKGKGHDG